jgi:hypothetical protein
VASGSEAAIARFSSNYRSALGCVREMRHVSSAYRIHVAVDRLRLLDCDINFIVFEAA